jgi:hypothetical protein
MNHIPKIRNLQQAQQFTIEIIISANSIFLFCNHVLFDVMLPQSI